MTTLPSITPPIDIYNECQKLLVLSEPSKLNLDTLIPGFQKLQVITNRSLYQTVFQPCFTELARTIRHYQILLETRVKATGVSLPQITRQSSLTGTQKVKVSQNEPDMIIAREMIHSAVQKVLTTFRQLKVKPSSAFLKELSELFELRNVGHNFKDLFRMLEANAIDKNFLLKNGNTLLQESACMADLNALKLLLREGLDIDGCGVDNPPPLFQACLAYAQVKAELDALEGNVVERNLIIAGLGGSSSLVMEKKNNLESIIHYLLFKRANPSFEGRGLTVEQIAVIERVYMEVRVNKFFFGYLLRYAFRTENYPKVEELLSKNVAAIFSVIPAGAVRALKDATKALEQTKEGDDQHPQLDEAMKTWQKQSQMLTQRYQVQTEPICSQFKASQLGGLESNTALINVIVSYVPCVTTIRIKKLGSKKEPKISKDVVVVV